MGYQGNNTKQANRGRVLEGLQENHSGVSKLKALARSRIWWPNMDKEIKRHLRLV